MTLSKQKILYIIGVLVIALILLSALTTGIFFYNFSNECSNKVAGLSEQSMEVEDKLNKIPLISSVDKVNPDGDCLTGSGISFEFTVQKGYQNSIIAKNEIAQSLATASILELTDSAEPMYISDEKSTDTSEGKSIQQLKVTYALPNQDSYEFTFKLDRPVLCTPNPQNPTFCGNDSSDIFLKQALSSQPVSSVKFKGSVKYEDQ